MKYNYLILASLLSVSGAFAMEQSSVTPAQVTLEDYNAQKDEQTTLELIKEDWANQYVGKPFNEKLAKLLIEMPYNSTNAPSLTAGYNKVFKLNGNIIGFITYYSHNQRPCTIEAQNNKKEGYIELFSLKEQYHNKGIAEHFLRTIVLPQLKKNGAQYMVAYLQKTDAKNIALFESVGFKKTGEERHQKESWALVKHNLDDIQ